MRRLLPAVLALAVVGSSATRAEAQAIRTGFVTTTMAAGDDNYSPQDYGFNINYFGFTSDAGMVCTNGYTIMNYFAPSSNACAFPAATSANPPATPNLPGLRSFYGSTMVPYFADFNTTVPGSGGIEIGNGLVGLNLAWSATWNQVLGYDDFATEPSTFQIVLINLNATGDFIMEFNYGHVAAGSIGGVGFTDDVSGSYQFAAPGVELADDTRLTCTFEDGLPTCSSFIVTPEPASMALMGTGLLGIFGFGFRRRRTTAA